MGQTCNSIKSDAGATLGWVFDAKFSFSHLNPICEYNGQSGDAHMITSYRRDFRINLENDPNCPLIGYCEDAQDVTWKKPLYQSCAGGMCTLGIPAQCSWSCSPQNTLGECNTVYSNLSGHKCETVAYIMDDAVSNALCSTKNGAVNPIYYLGFAGSLSMTSMTYVYGLLFLLLIIINIVTGIKLCKRRKESQKPARVEVYQHELKNLKMGNVSSNDDHDIL
eukprot:49193_1